VDGTGHSLLPFWRDLARNRKEDIEDISSAMSMSEDAPRVGAGRSEGPTGSAIEASSAGCGGGAAMLETGG
jgi:hypothetical protein